MDLENISSDIMDKVITEMNSYHYNSFSNEDIEEALNKEYLSIISELMFSNSIIPPHLKSQ